MIQLCTHAFIVCLRLFMDEISNSLEQSAQFVVVAGMGMEVWVICFVWIVLFDRGRAPVSVIGWAACSWFILLTVARWPLLWSVGGFKTTVQSAVSILIPAPELSCRDAWPNAVITRRLTWWFWNVVTCSRPQANLLRVETRRWRSAHIIRAMRPQAAGAPRGPCWAGRVAALPPSLSIPYFLSSAPFYLFLLFPHPPSSFSPFCYCSPIPVLSLPPHLFPSFLSAPSLSISRQALVI